MAIKGLLETFKIVFDGSITNITLIVFIQQIVQSCKHENIDADNFYTNSNTPTIASNASNN